MFMQHKLYIIIYFTFCAGPIQTAEITHELCGYISEDTVLSSSNVLTVAFITDSELQYQGFVIEYVSGTLRVTVAVTQG